ncbi:GxxExxY protein [Syntrophotalea acetylenivorans]|uniref:GxxExxY protein n=1 Tax=Syntrophotalea acetylenivorans TaxID=1842532 RepID=A0A1L3GL25_9BACT|nr:GxxExxY protein [Syntrophotalea acetylenivorans]APG26643.1 GxxExxY protein [Syntrophotalea acetylenivorans]
MVREVAYHDSLTEQIIGCAYSVGNALGEGFLEKVYENALAHELEKTGLKVSRQEPITVVYDGVVVGDYFADMIVEEEIIIELKAVKNIDNSHLAQCINYLKATGKKLALLINFGNSRVQVKRVINTKQVSPSA